MKSIALLNEVPAEEANRMAYKDMNTFYYIAATLGFYAIIIIGAITIT